MASQGLTLVLDPHDVWVIVTALDYHVLNRGDGKHRPPHAMLDMYTRLAVQLAEYLEATNGTAALRISYPSAEESVGGHNW